MSSAASGEVMESHSLPQTPPRTSAHELVICAPPSQLRHSPSLTRSPLLAPNTPRSTATTPSRFMTPLASPVRKAMASMRMYHEEYAGHLTSVNPQDSWLPITESRSGNAFYAAFHTLCSGIGFQALLLPVAFAYLGWTWGIVSLSLAFIWQLYTLWLLTQVHESNGTRHSRFLPLCMLAFGDKLGKLLAKFPIMYLSAGTCTALIVTGGGSLRLFYEIACGPTCNSKPLTPVQWYLVFVCLAVLIAQFPNLNSIAGVSLIGSIFAVGYCTIIWVLSVTKGRPAGVSYAAALGTESVSERALMVINGLGLIVFTFRGHNLVLEIQGTMPSTQKCPSHVPMWRGVQFAYAVIACCLFPIAIAGYWAYGNLIPPTGILVALHKFHDRDTSRIVLGLTTLVVVINCLSLFQIYAMIVFDNFESGYTGRKNKPCPRWLRSAIRIFFGFLAFLVSVAIPFLQDLAGLLGGIAMPVTFAYPCFIWIVMKKPKRYSTMWIINLALGAVGMALSLLLIVGSVWKIAVKGLNVRFFKAQ